MKAIRLISLVARVALMITLGLGLLYWIAQLFGWSGPLVFLAQIGFPNIHEVFGSIGVLGLLILGGISLQTRGSRLLGTGGMIYALLVPAFGMTQALILVGNLHWLIRAAHLLVGVGAMMLVIRIEKRYQLLNLKEHGVTAERPLGKPYPPIVVRLARLATAAHVSLYRLTGGTIGGRAQNMPVLLLTTTGRRSGKHHTTPLVYLTDGDDWVVVASNGGQARLPNWWLNIRGSKQASIEVGRKQLRVSAQEANPEERKRLWPRVVAYRAGHENYQERTPYPLPLVIFHPEGTF
ncbi:MAG TPA: nitroreductase family deazaflavin-dependent oxidoreductase [Ktedonosporobacter sp.]|nr:nitroreductase family deazaflavin-dependent oxidoreductase [Ktedonosporobacter sp.]